MVQSYYMIDAAFMSRARCVVCRSIIYDEPLNGVDALEFTRQIAERNRQGFLFIIAGNSE